MISALFLGFVPISAFADNVPPECTVKLTMLKECVCHGEVLSGEVFSVERTPAPTSASVTRWSLTGAGIAMKDMQSPEVFGALMPGEYILKVTYRAKVDGEYCDLVSDEAKVTVCAIPSIPLVADMILPHGTSIVPGRTVENASGPECCENKMIKVITRLPCCQYEVSRTPFNNCGYGETKKHFVQLQNPPLAIDDPKLVEVPGFWKQEDEGVEFKWKDELPELDKKCVPVIVMDASWTIENTILKGKYSSSEGGAKIGFYADFFGGQEIVIARWAHHSFWAGKEPRKFNGVEYPGGTVDYYKRLFADNGIELTKETPFPTRNSFFNTIDLTIRQSEKTTGEIKLTLTRYMIPVDKLEELKWSNMRLFNGPVERFDAKGGVISNRLRVPDFGDFDKFKWTLDFEGLNRLSLDTSTDTKEYKWR